MLPNGIDIAVLVIIGIFVYLGWKKGFVNMGIQLFSTALALGCAWLFHPLLANSLRETALYESLLSSAVNPAEPTAKMPGTLQELGALTGNAVAEYVAQLLLNGISFLLILIFVKLLLFFLRKFLKFVTSLPVLGIFNRLSGMAVGLIEGLLVVWILLAVLVVVPTLRENKRLGYSIEQSVIARSLYHHNFLLNAVMPAPEGFGKK